MIIGLLYTYRIHFTSGNASFLCRLWFYKSRTFSNILFNTATKQIAFSKLLIYWYGTATWVKLSNSGQ